MNLFDLQILTELSNQEAAALSGGGGYSKPSAPPSVTINNTCQAAFSCAILPGVTKI